MEILKVLTLRGPNCWSRRSVIEAWVDLHQWVDVASNMVPGFYDRLTGWLPGLVEHRCSVGERGGFLQRLREGTYPAHMLEHVTIELQNLAGANVGFGKARETSKPGVYKVVARFRDEQLAHAALRTARELLLSALEGKDFDVAPEVARLRELADQVSLGPSTAAIVNAAEARNIPARRLNHGSLVQLGYGAKQRRIWTAETDRTSAVAESIAQDKELTKSLLRAAGVPVPDGRPVESAAAAWSAAEDIGLPVVVKPRDGNHGRGVSTQLTTQHQVEQAYAVAAAEGGDVLVERFIPGNEHRVLVVGDRVVAAARGETAYVFGDGKNNIRQLVELQLNSDPRRGEGDEFPLSRVEIDATTLLDLERQGFTAESVPPGGHRVLIQRNGNIAFDVTDVVHPRVAEAMVMAARVVGLDIAGIDVVALDISCPLQDQGGAVVEVNAGPGLHMHLKPANGSGRPVGEAIAELLFPPGETGRIPVACVTGTNGKTTVTQLLAHLLRGNGQTVGTASTEGIQVGQRFIERTSSANAAAARRLLLNPAVEAAVLEADRESILTEGLGFDRCDVAIVTNVGEADQLGQHFIDTPEQMFTVKRCAVDVVLPTGMAVLKADDALVAEMAPLCAGGVTLFALDGTHPVMVAHRSAGKRVAHVKAGRLILAQGADETDLLAVETVPLSHRGTLPFQVENVLAAAAAGWAMGLSMDALRQGLLSFKAAGEACQGRFDLFEHQGRRVVVDDCHNSHALRAVLAALDQQPGGKRCAVYSVGHARRDDEIIRQGELLAEGFDRVILYDDHTATERAPGDVRALLRQGMEKGGRVSEVLDVPAHRDALQKALTFSAPGDVLMLQTEDDAVGATVDTVLAWGARRLDA